MARGVWAVVVGAAVFGYWGYRKLQEMEQGIRRELHREANSGTAEQGPEERPGAGETEPSGLEARIRQRVRQRPGVLQTELYREFPRESRRHLQQVLLEMDRQGKLKREKEKATFRLYPGG